MKFTRELTSKEIAVLGSDWKMRLMQIIDNAINGITTTNRTTSTSSKLLALISDTSPMTVADMHSAYNAIYGENSVAFNYVRSMVNRLRQQGFIKRTGNGRYVKEHKS